MRRGCAEEARAVLWSTHLTEEAARADRIIVLNQGSILHDGPVASLLERAASDNIEAAFLSMTRAAPAGRPDARKTGKTETAS